MHPNWRSKLIDCFRQAQLPPGTQVHLFGSRARGDAGDRADIDLAFEGHGDYKIQRLDELIDALNIPFKVDLVDLSKVSSEFYTKAKSEGQLLYEEKRS